MVSQAQMYTPAQVAALLQLSRTKTYQLLADGEVPSIRIGRSLRVRADDLRDFVESRRSGIPEPASTVGN